ncbi:coagulation factor IIIa [Cololabis saira]|uniref:coagulation factor IIIa n=1 Tax=Cololabis saira TaxID=129043 RepID=UPI002AD44557|nr:coagulation factor IIIa [Cololabis saira]
MGVTDINPLHDFTGIGTRRRGPAPSGDVTDGRSLFGSIRSMGEKKPAPPTHRDPDLVQTHKIRDLDGRKSASPVKTTAQRPGPGADLVQTHGSQTHQTRTFRPPDLVQTCSQTHGSEIWARKTTSPTHGSGFSVKPRTPRIRIMSFTQEMSGSKWILLVLLFARCASGSYPRAENVTWKSTNFKTVLTWGPEPTPDYTYTVEFYAIGGNKQRNHHCTRSSQTSCDLSASMTDVQSCYRADIVSEPPLGATSDLVEFPHTTTSTFCPYKETDIGRPDFELRMSEDKSLTTLVVSDPLTALFSDRRQLNVRDVFGEKLQYKVTYRKNRSTGTKVQTSPSSLIQLQNLDPGESYCFSVQAFIPDRTGEKQLSEMSSTKCSHDDHQSLFKVYSLGSIVGGVLLLLLLVGGAIGVGVFCCRRRRSQRAGKEAVPLRAV